MSANLMSLARSGGKFLKLFGDRKMMKPLPYDAEVEYLESTGTQFIDADFIPTIDSAIEIDVVCTSQSSAYTGVAFCGNYFNSYHAFGIGRYSSPFAIAYFGNKNNINCAGFGINNRCVISLNVEKLALTNVDSGTTGSTAVGATSFDTSTRSLYILNGNTNTMDLKIHANFQIYGCKLWNGITLVRDFIPVRVGSGSSAVGYLYDRVSGELFGNAGTGEFLIGPDKTV